MNSSTLQINPINGSDRHRLIDDVLNSVPVRIRPTDSERTQTSSVQRAPEKDGQQCAALRHLRKDTDREESRVRPKTDAAVCQTNMHRGYSLRKRYKESREPLQDCGCGKEKGETAVVAILLLLSLPLSASGSPA